MTDEVEKIDGELAQFLQINIKRLEELSVLVRGDLLPLERKILTALITIDVHARDIVDNLYQYDPKHDIIRCIEPLIFVKILIFDFFKLIYYYDGKP